MAHPQARLGLVTGASSGIGRELAELFVDDAFDLIICAEDAGIEDVAVRLRKRGREVTAVRADLRTADGVEALYTAVRNTGRPLNSVALNAGIGHGGAFVDTDLAEDLSIIDLNVRSTVHLAKLVLRDMVERDSGKLLITSSIASMMPGSFQATYNASKSFLQSFAEALQNELKDSAVTVTSLMPGPTETNFFHRAEMDDTRIGQMSKDDPAEVARQGYHAMMSGKARSVAASTKTRIMAGASMITPDAVKAALHRVLSAPGSGSTS
ncbi:SDR family NAD(P)-dependent oxidoreductase [Gordonia amicalis]|uniref:SDR family NAD(P)-dependent oxidoreductase n=1 Tax=Gordonia amicalis TaxID=89053 RepID=UPI0002A62988|nr:SDR family NAD(P)-dependent oxidoreductase [Gordonia amicalis]MBA5845740.1 SDR family NAD(P)-dependent oxidoreductase [Gordonia amicalis]MCZ0914820.1 SDR family NAD(P)-dependent oxidoreductase [Gordonia amicalis]MDV7099314.1 SDR family NAD(P)-dependent oxidoreductase [Gordonia amicalis]MDV7174807.1 SDR family NAD(P)-dependent oxidoreductase [Gordonia amicalis]NKX78401.1 SDR family NAD(P)-dependent oxidoreductase [Gordonia amicalis]